MEFKAFSLMVNQSKVGVFADYLARGKIMATMCKSCKAEYYPPQADCPQCTGDRMEWIECPTQGKLVSFTQIMVLPEHFSIPQPSIPFGKASLTPSPVGLLEVRDGIRIMGWIPEASPEELQVGEQMNAYTVVLDDGRVTVAFEKIQ
jgi:uncharacterized OB-fold protein